MYTGGTLLAGVLAGSFIAFMGFLPTAGAPKEPEAPSQIRGSIISANYTTNTLVMRVDPYEIEGTLILHFDKSTKWKSIVLTKKDGIVVSSHIENVSGVPSISPKMRITSINTRMRDGSLYAPSLLISEIKNL